ncbi:MAG: hypothetical protein GY913_23740 [Proteobacteria bacterium]|nr:hypothetical protein [Pseudomonadota bacterium]MCP4919927.1 hypothetical protein [Pseudomonadota bacterium]
MTTRRQLLGGLAALGLWPGVASAGRNHSVLASTGESLEAKAQKAERVGDLTDLFDAELAEDGPPVARLVLGLERIEAGDDPGARTVLETIQTNHWTSPLAVMLTSDVFLRAGTTSSRTSRSQPTAR